MPDLLGRFPRLSPEPQQTIAGAGRDLRDGGTTCLKLLQGCFDQIEAWEGKVHAWVILDRDRALEQARALDRELKAGRDRGPLHGIPIGVKDIIDVAGLPTACGSKRWADSVAPTDAYVVARLRESGAVILGKTVTTPYAWIDPPVTRNPWNLDRTPGGSSSGSAAAVATGMCSGAIGTQTGGSITRPASFCGVAGLKPAQDALSRDGIRPFAPSLDHVGPIARTVDDLRILLMAMGYPPIEPIPARESPFTQRRAGPRLGRLRGFFDRRAEPAVRDVFDEAVRAFAAQGAEIVALDDPIDFEQVLKDHRRVMAAEAADVHSVWLDEFPGEYPPRIRDLILEGRGVTALEYLKSRKAHGPLFNYRNAVTRTNLDAVIAPASLSTAPDLSTTGDPAFNSPWSYMHIPTVSFPTSLAVDGLPIAVQVVGIDGNGLALLRVAEWCEQAVKTWRQ
jgi:aspartyl-tRNA(Asn)/glutamyl-tRNA(Gln) amidotransferase subunit A